MVRFENFFQQNPPRQSQLSCRVKHLLLCSRILIKFFFGMGLEILLRASIAAELLNRVKV